MSKQDRAGSIAAWTLPRLEQGADGGSADRRASGLVARLTRRSSGLVVALSMATTLPVPIAWAGPPDEASAPAPRAKGGRVALLKFSGPGGDGLRYGVQSALVDEGYDVVGLRQSFADSATKVKCKSQDDACIGAVTDYLVKNSAKPIDYFAYGAASDQPGVSSTVTIVEVASKKVVARVKYAHSDDDLIIVAALPRTLVTRLVEAQVPPPPISEEEKAVIATLDEPAKTPEEMLEEQQKIEAAKKAALTQYNQGMDTGEIAVDLKKDFKELCRKGPREDTVVQREDGSEDRERDPRPACKLGPALGYFRPRTWIMGTLTLLGGASTIAMYGLALGSYGKWKTAKGDLEDSGLTPDDPATRVEYARLAGQVSESGDSVRKFALGGDIALAATALFGVVLIVTIVADRKEARRELGTYKEMKISNLNVAPVIGRDVVGAGAGFRF